VLLDSAKSIPVPDSVIVWGLLAALSVTVIVPLWLPAPRGEKVTLIVQLPPAESEAGQVLVSAKLPVRAMVRGVRAALPVFVSVIVCAAL